ncbi:hypothetical protein PsorP6_012230 [Peronosclerospora sorghi]|uniref:Uncharacterized protein n=1 Tax=Peronosclerospora sorghi TaxID=230839 RepID=A0ACC0WIT2_9STRA|nr:hypothetical protein PsorP6_012230 [Peronosclerospora sorghi]
MHYLPQKRKNSTPPEQISSHESCGAHLPLSDCTQHYSERQMLSRLPSASQERHASLKIFIKRRKPEIDLVSKHSFSAFSKIAMVTIYFMKGKVNVNWTVETLDEPTSIFDTIDHTRATSVGIVSPFVRHGASCVPFKTSLVSICLSVPIKTNTHPLQRDFSYSNRSEHSKCADNSQGPADRYTKQNRKTSFGFLGFFIRESTGGA